jgi:FkbM family methyltransferase
MTQGCGPLLRFGKLRFCLGGPGNVPAYHEIFFQGDYRSLTIRPDDIILDAGANAGLFSIWAASRCRSVVSVEPAPETFDLLKLNKLINKATNVLLINKALSDHDGFVSMGGEGATYKIEQHGIIIPSTTIDSLLAELGVSVDVVKMDVEGAERLCLPGSYLQHVREIVVETHATEDSVVRILQEYGFKTTKVNFRVPRTIATILKRFPYFVRTELATNFLISRSTLRAFMRREDLLLRERLPQFQIIHGYKS